MTADEDACTDDDCYLEHCGSCHCHVRNRALCDECEAVRADMIRDQRKDDQLTGDLERLDRFNEDADPRSWK